MCNQHTCIFSFTPQTIAKHLEHTHGAVMINTISYFNNLTFMDLNYWLLRKSPVNIADLNLQSFFHSKYNPHLPRLQQLVAVIQQTGILQIATERKRVKVDTSKNPHLFYGGDYAKQKLRLFQMNQIVIVFLIGLFLSLIVLTLENLGFVSLKITLKSSCSILTNIQRSRCAECPKIFFYLTFVSAIAIFLIQTQVQVEHKQSTALFAFGTLSMPLPNSYLDYKKMLSQYAYVNSYRNRNTTYNKKDRKFFFKRKVETYHLFLSGYFYGFFFDNQKLKYHKCIEVLYFLVWMCHYLHAKKILY